MGQFSNADRRRQPSCRWDLFSVGYTDAAVPDLVGIWKANAPIDRLATLLYTAAAQPPLVSYKSIVFVSHSMGWTGDAKSAGGITPTSLPASVMYFSWNSQRGSQEKPAHSAFSKTASPGHGREFRVHQRSAEAVERPVRLISSLQVPDDRGDQDEFVPSDSSLDPFLAAQRSVVPEIIFRSSNLLPATIWDSRSW